MHRHSPIYISDFIRALLSLIIPLCLAAAPGYGADYYLHIDTGGMAASDTTSTTIDRHAAYLTGSLVELIVRVRPTQTGDSELSYTGITDWTWPQGMQIQAGYGTDPSSFTPSQTLYDQMHPSYIVNTWQMHWDSVWHANGTLPPHRMRNPEYRFAVFVPQSAAGMGFCARASFLSSNYGTLQSNVACHWVSAPQSAWDTAFVRSSLVCEAERSGPHALATTLADSLLELGWRGLTGLVNARKAAQAQGHFSDAIRYLDYCFDANHMVQIPLDVEDTTGSTAEYEQLRQWLLDHSPRPQR